MRTIHVVRKYDLAEWGGTEMAVQRLLRGLAGDAVDSVLYCPSLNGQTGVRVPQDTAFGLRHYNVCVPVWGLSPEEKRQFVAIGGNLFSFDLLPALWFENRFDLIHTHTLGRLGGIAAAIARKRRVPFVVTIHGGFLDLPGAMKKEIHAKPKAGFDWGRIFGFLLKSRQMLFAADALLTCNAKEAAMLREAFPGKLVQVQPHGIPVADYEQDCRAAALAAVPEINGRPMLLCVGRIDPVKNQSWLIEQASRIFEEHAEAVIVFAGAWTDEAYAATIKTKLKELNLGNRLIFTGVLPPGDPRLIGLFQLSKALVLPSISETFGLVLLEAWAAGTTVISSRTSGASALIEHGVNGWLFDLKQPRDFHEAVNAVLSNAALRKRAAVTGKSKVKAEYDMPVIAHRVKQLYDQLIEAKTCTT
jgi:glycosyltransferase involved in cell wall biosynthesis